MWQQLDQQHQQLAQMPQQQQSLAHVKGGGKGPGDSSRMWQELEGMMDGFDDQFKWEAMTNYSAFSASQSSGGWLSEQDLDEPLQVPVNLSTALASTWQLGGLPLPPGLPPPPPRGAPEQPEVALAQDQAQRLPLLIWCGFDPGSEPDRAMTTQRRMYFRGHVHFTRWLFMQPRGAVQPFAVLVVSWREAKPCAVAIGAARSGKVDALRIDSKRPELPEITGEVPPDGLVGIAISSVIILAEDEEQQTRALQWAARKGNHMTSLDIQIAQTAGEQQTATLAAGALPAGVASEQTADAELPIRVTPQSMWTGSVISL